MTALATDRETWVGVRDAARHLGVSRSFVFKACAAGTIPHARIGRALRFKLSDLDEWAKGSPQ